MADFTTFLVKAISGRDRSCVSLIPLPAPPASSNPLHSRPHGMPPCPLHSLSSLLPNY